MINKRQRIVGIIFAIVILITSFVILEKSALAGIIGLCVAGGLVIYCFSGKQDEAQKGRISIKTLLKNKFVKISLIVSIVLIIAFIVYSIYSPQTPQQHDNGVSKREIAITFNNNLQLQNNIELVSGRIEIETWPGGSRSAYLFVTIKNTGEEDMASKIDMHLTYFDKNKYQISEETVTVSKLDRVYPKEEKKYKVGLLGFDNDIEYIQGSLLVRPGLVIKRRTID